jgi:carboxymethylenebutenolidase
MEIHVWQVMNRINGGVAMSEYVTLKSADGHEPSAYVARPEGKPIAGLVVVQEIFGVNAHIRSVADGYAKDGFLAVAPALFDRIERGVQLGYDGDDLQRAMGFVPKLDPAKALLDIAAAMEFAGNAMGKKVGVIGYCFGGTMAWLAATRLHPAAAVGYYAGHIGNYAGETPSAPVMLHFGKQDAHIPAEEVEKVHAAHPEVEIYRYDAGHGFNCDARASYNGGAAREARERSLRFLKKHLA